MHVAGKDWTIPADGCLESVTRGPWLVIACAGRPRLRSRESVTPGARRGAYIELPICSVVTVSVPRQTALACEGEIGARRSHCTTARLAMTLAFLRTSMG